MLRRLSCWLLLLLAAIPRLATGQTGNADTISGVVSLGQCIQFALQNQPALKQSLIDEAIQKANINIALSSWLPQANLNANLIHYFELPTTVTTNFTNPSAGKIAFQSGVYNNSTPQFSATENIFNNDVLYAATTAKYYKVQSKQEIENTKINVVVDVSKAYYNVLLSMLQITILDEDIVRLEKSLKDARSQYEAGIVDKVDYKRATIALNTSKVQLKAATEALPAKYAQLRQLMGLQDGTNIELQVDTAAMLQEINYDTTASLDIANRIEYQQLQTTQTLQKQNTRYYKNAFLPSLSAYYNYNWVYQNDKFDQLYNKQYPNSLVGLNFSLPLFQGFKRTQNIRKSKLQEERLGWDEVNLKLQINSEYEQSLATYKASLEALGMAKENVAIAREVYDVVFLQYREGVKEYLEVITAESDLKTSQVNHLNAVFQLLVSRLDLQKSTGSINVNY
ncbi:TolC family protein [Taibaiella soli]|uniref:TolC family protein n=1 Tax=Taibaiella soli TaxID=1649169 RepID=A0A2W2AED3_9BACT|nr:TolC family protein [Taibaiella soli]PZF73651.1 TolC family protein [Taibaiella soli]